MIVSKPSVRLAWDGCAEFHTFAAAARSICPALEPHNCGHSLPQIGVDLLSLSYSQELSASPLQCCNFLRATSCIKAVSSGSFGAGVLKGRREAYLEIVEIALLVKMPLFQVSSDSVSAFEASPSAAGHLMHPGHKCEGPAQASSEAL